MDGWKEQLIDRFTVKWMDKGMDGWNNYWTVMPHHTVATYASENDDFPTNFLIFTKPLRTN